jgi:hypothetical protein
MKNESFGKRAVAARYVPVLLGLLVLFLGLRCWPFHRGYVYFETDTYNVLDGLRADVGSIYESFTHDVFDHGRIDDVNRRFDQVYDHEHSNGHSKQADQIDRIRKKFRGDVDDRMNHGRWDEQHRSRHYDDINKEFDHARPQK